MDVKVTVGVQSPESVSLKRVSGRLPHGKVVVKAVRGGLNVVDTDNNTISVIATAAVEAYIAIDETKWIPPRK